MIMTRYTKKHFFRLFEIFIFYPCIAFLCSILGVFGYFLAVNELGYRSHILTQEHFFKKNMIFRNVSRNIV